MANKATQKDKDIENLESKNFELQARYEELEKRYEYLKDEKTFLEQELNQLKECQSEILNDFYKLQGKVEAYEFVFLRNAKGR